MKTFEDVQLVIADTRLYTLANNALCNSISEIKFGDIAVYSDHPDFGRGYRQISIQRLDSIEKYNELITNLVPEHLDKEFCLIIQYDGFVLNPSQFSNEFYDYDYIGAIWPQHDSNRVGNGGFSLRSRRLMNIVSELKHLRRRQEPEDVFVCRTLRTMLERDFAIKFAPEDLANRFSYEAIGPRNTFGFHGFSNLPYVYSSNPRYLLENIPPDVLKNRLGELLRGALLLPDAEKREFDAELARLISLA